MTDGQLLYLAFTALYLFECVRWVPERCWIFHARNNGTSWTHSKPWGFFRARGGAVALLNPLPPFEIHTRTATCPCVPHQQGLCVWDAEVKFAQHLPWETLKVQAEESVIHFTEKLHVRCLNAHDAKNCVGLIHDWKTQNEEERDQSFLKMARDKFEDKNLTEAVRHLQEQIRYHRLLSHAVFWTCFLFLPFSYWRFATTLPTFVVIGLLYLFMFSQAFLLWRRVRRDPALHPGAWPRILSAAFFPPSSIRVIDWLSEMKIPDSHPLTLLQKQSGSECFHQEAARFWRESRWPLGDFPYRPWDGPEVEALSIFLKSAGLKTQDLEVPPPLLTASTPYCPRCLITYAENAHECSDCTGISLMKSTASL